MKITSISLFVSCLILLESCNLIRSNSFPKNIGSIIREIAKFTINAAESLVVQVDSDVGNVVNLTLSTAGSVVKPIVSTVVGITEKTSFSLVLNLFKNILPSWFRRKFPVVEIFKIYLKYLTNPKTFGPVEPECNMNVPEMIRHLGFTAEVHKVITTDGYILEIHRIPFGRKSRSTIPGEPVLLQHALLSSSADWVNNLENQSLAFMLANSGYDVWLSNVRGNVYSRNHVNSHMNIRNKTFWDFSWQEMAHIDLPSMIDYILKTTFKTKLTYIGHSMGTTMGFALFSSEVAYSDKVRRFIALGPVTSLHHIESIVFKSLLFVSSLFIPIFRLIGWYYILDSGAPMHFFAQSVCKGLVMETACVGLVSTIVGVETVENFNISRSSIYFSHTPAGTSLNTLQHFVQFVQQTCRAKKFQMYDYGKKRNMDKYKQTTPPTYNLGNMQIPVSLFYARNDIISTPSEALMIVSQLPSHLVEFYDGIDNFSHLDLNWGMHANHLINNKIIQLLKMGTGQRFH